MATGIQPISRGWIGLDAQARRGDIPIRQVILQSIAQKKEDCKFFSEAHQYPILTISAVVSLDVLTKNSEFRDLSKNTLNIQSECIGLSFLIGIFQFSHIENHVLIIRFKSNPTFH